MSRSLRRSSFRISACPPRVCRVPSSGAPRSLRGLLNPIVGQLHEAHRKRLTLLDWRSTIEGINSNPFTVPVYVVHGSGPWRRLGRGMTGIGNALPPRSTFRILLGQAGSAPSIYETEFHSCRTNAVHAIEKAARPVASRKLSGSCGKAREGALHYAGFGR
jgi:hypothetical protein